MQADQIRRIPVSPAQRSLRLLKESVLAEVKPQVGIISAPPGLWMLCGLDLHRVCCVDNARNGSIASKVFCRAGIGYPK